VQDRVPPQDMDAEAVILSAVLYDPESFDRIAAILHASHFYADANRQIWMAAVALSDAGKPTDVTAVAGILRDRKLLDRVGGTPYLAQLYNTQHVVDLESHARRIADRSRLRAVIAEARVIEAEAYGAPENVSEFVQSAEARIYAAAGESDRTVTSESSGEIMASCVTEIARRYRGEAPAGHSTGFPGLDLRIGGLRDGRVYVIAARPGMGKTSLATQMIRSVVTSNAERRGVLFASLEMPRDQIGERLISQECVLDTRKVELGMLTRQEWTGVTEASSKIGKWPLIIEDRAALTVSLLRSSIRRAARRLEREFGVGLGMVALDYLQLMGDTDLPRGLNDNSRIERQSAGIKDISKEFNVPVLLLSQLNRDCEKRPNKRPQLSDLRSSGAIEQDAHTIMFLYRDDQYREEGAVKDNQAEVIIAKARGGRTGVFHAGFLPYCAKFDDAGELDADDELALFKREAVELGDALDEAIGDAEVRYP
jgi:replicative DNA helicase